MAAVNFYGLTGVLAAAVDSSSTVIQVDSALAGALAAGMDDGDVTYLALTAGTTYELAKVTYVYGNYLTVERGVNGIFSAFPLGTHIAFVLTAEAIISALDIPPLSASLQGSGLAQVSQLDVNSFLVHVPELALVGDDRIEVTGAWPNIQLSLVPASCCGEGEAAVAGGIVSLQGEGIIQAYATGAEGYINLPAPNFVGVGVTIAGSWPDYTFTVSSGAGGTVTSVAAGPGLSISGSPNVAPVVNLNASGVLAGTYGGVTINVRGIIEAVPPTFNPVSIINVTAPIQAVRAADAVTLSVADAAIGVKGVVELVDDTDPFDPLNVTKAMTPAAVKTALDTIAAASLVSADSYTSEPDASYVNTISASAVSLELATGEKALVIASATVTNNTDPTIPHTWGLAVFNGTPTKIKANKSIKQIQQSLMFVVEGPVTVTNLALVTTDLTGATLQSYGLQVLKI